MISVVIPTHNRLNYLIRALNSLSCQTELPHEVVVVDDCSIPPVSNELIKNFDNFFIIKLLRNKKVMGSNYSRNVGIRASSSHWIAFLDDDDEFLKDKIKEINIGITNFSTFDLFYHFAEIYMVNEKVRYFTNPKIFLNDENMFNSLLVTNCIGGTPMVVALKNSLTSAGLFDEGMPALQDYELWLRMAKQGMKFKFIDQPLSRCHYTTKKKSVSKSAFANKKALEIIETRYADDYALLSPAEWKRHEEWKRHMLVHKALLNGQVLQASRLQLSQFFRTLNPKHLLAACAFLLGPKFVFRMRARLR